jgi:hypothetical protein
LWHGIGAEVTTTIISQNATGDGIGIHWREGRAGIPFCDWGRHSRTNFCGVRSRKEDDVLSFSVSRFQFFKSVIQFSFWVTEVDEDGEEQDFWNGEDTEFIPREERAQICLKLKTAAEMLIFAERPRCVGLCAADAQERAYHRFLLVAEVFRENWYRVTELEPHLGSRAWHMERAGL